MIKKALSAVLAFAGIASVTCLPCWIPFIYLLQALGLIGILDPALTPYISAAPPLLTAAIIGYTTRAPVKVLTPLFLAGALFMGAGGWSAACIYIALGVIIWERRDEPCRIK